MIENPYLMFQSESDCLVALDKIWCNMLLDHANNEEKLVGDGIGEDYFLSEIENFEEHQLCALKAYGKINEVVQDRNGLTERWAFPWNCIDDTAKWVFQKPNDSFMNGVVGYTVVEYDKNWYPNDTPA